MGHSKYLRSKDGRVSAGIKSDWGAIACQKLLLEMYQTKQQNNHSQIITKLMIFENKQQSSSLRQPKQPFSLARLLARICPCLSFRHDTQSSESDTNHHEETKEDLNKKNHHHESVDLKKDQLVTVETLVGDPLKKNSLVFSSLHPKSHPFEEQDISKTTAKKWHLYPINSLRQNQLVMVGRRNQKILCRIKTVLLHSSQEAKNQNKRTRIVQGSRQDSKFSQSYIDKYWNQRYQLFGKFDEGISINDSSWPVIVPEAVSDHVASQVKCETVVNMCCGVGGDAIKLANTCNRVYAWDGNIGSLQCLHINSKIYSAENISIMDNCQKLKTIQPQVVVVSSYTKLQQQCLNTQQTNCQKMNPNLSIVIKKALTICPNIVLILPANINIDQLASVIVKHTTELQIVTQSCCLKIQKIYYASQFKHLIVYFGNYITKSVAINDELLWIYNYLGLDVVRWKADRKFIKKLRQTYGMVRLLNFTLQSGAKAQGDPMFKLYIYVKQMNLLPTQKLHKYEQQKKSQLEVQELQAKQHSEEQKQKTISEVSIPSILNRVSTDQLQGDNQEYDPYKSVPMYATKSLFKPKQNIKSVAVKHPRESMKEESYRDSRESDVTSFKYIN